MTDIVHLVRLGADPSAVTCMHKVGPDDITAERASTHLRCEGLDYAAGVWVMRLRRVPAEVVTYWVGDEARTFDPWAELRVPGWRSLLDSGWRVLVPAGG